MRFKMKKEEEIGTGIAPLVDIVFLLLLFFAITYHFDIASGVRIDLPKVTQKASDNDTEKVTLIVNKSADIFLLGKKLDLKELEKELQALVEEKSYLKVILQADKDVSHGKVVEIMDVAKNAGINSVIIAARWKADELD
ncbi:MAG: biopolymer transporter ExbD [Deltaproteobacteria bacterium]|nr:biopolymer transporter ExbD [Deltaproteobacteria bacterium]